MLAGFIGFLSLFLIVGLASSLRKQDTSEDYYIASRSVGPWLTSLSAVSTTLSGFMFMGMIGLTWLLGVYAYLVWVAMSLGNYLLWGWSFSRLRSLSEKENVNTIPAFLAKSNSSFSRLLQIVIALVCLAFLSTYAAAQLNAGSKALHVLLGWDLMTGTWVGSAIVLLYCLAGGIRASIWTDAIQSIVMLFAIGLLCFVCVNQIGGFAALWQGLAKQNPNLVSWSPDTMKFGPWVYLGGMLFMGAGILAQPHIMVRAMAMKSIDCLKQSRRIYFFYYNTFALLVITVGLCCRILLPEPSQFDSELALPLLAAEALAPFLAGMILAGIFAATMSTADSLILTCSAAITKDLANSENTSSILPKIGTFLVTGAVLLIALFGDKSVFSLVIFAWSALAATLGPPMIIRTFGGTVPPATGIVMIFSGLATTLIWRNLGLHMGFSEVLPSILVAFASGWMAYQIEKRVSNQLSKNSRFVRV